jgi:CRP-like cAMP-binding protein/predicted acylesterase/phospholipase RssA
MDLATWMRDSELFHDMDEDTVSQLRSMLGWRTVLGGELVIAQGSPANHVHIIAAGHYEVTRVAINGQPSVLGEVGPGEVLGTAALVAEEPNDADVRAMRDGFIVEFSPAAIEMFVALLPRGSLAVARFLSGRSEADYEPRSAGRAFNLVLVTLTGTEVLEAVAEPLVEALSNQLSTTAVRRQDLFETLKTDVTHTLSSEDHARGVDRMGVLESGAECLVLIADHNDREWVNRCVRQADRILLVAGASADPAITELEHFLFAQGGAGHRLYRDLLLVVSEGTDRAGQSLQWISSREISTHYTLMTGRQSDFERIASALASRWIGAHWLRGSSLFRNFAAEHLKLLESKFADVDLAGQHVLFEAGAEGDALYVVDSGRLQAYVTGADGSDQVIGEIGPGEVVGETALITGQRRTASVRAVRDSKLARLSRSSFERLTATHPELVLELARVVASRMSLGSVAAAPARAVNFALIPLGPGIEAEAAGFADGLKKIGSVMIVDAATVNAQLGPGTANKDQGQPGEVVLIEWLNNLEFDHDYVVYVADSELSAWTRRCLRQADQILLLTDAMQSPKITQLEQEALTDGGLGRYAKRSLVLVQQPNVQAGVGTGGWIKDRSIDRWYHVRRGNDQDHARLARLLTGRATGLVLGGGASRAIAHVGVYKALVEEKIPIDIIAGTSAGGAMGSLMAANWTPQQIIQGMSVLMGHTTRQLADMGPPLVSMVSGRLLRKELVRLYGEMKIEDQLVPCTIVSTDLAQADVYLHTSGLIWRAIRATTSLPAAWPPVLDGKHLLVDGGVLNNVPIDQVLPAASHGSVIACDVSPDQDYSDFDPYDSTLSGWRLLARSLMPGRKLRYPAMFDLISRCITLENARHPAVENLDPDRLLYLTPPVGEYGLFSIRSIKVIEKVVDTAYRDTREQLARWLQ